MPPVHYHANRFPPDKRLDWPKLIPHIGPTVAAVARYDGTLAAIPNPRLLLAPLTTREAVLSSRIEGTQATMGEVLEFEAGETPSSPMRREDIHEILNYRKAMWRAATLLEDLPLSLRVIREAHQILLSGVRGEGKSPGEFRRVPNLIGPPGCSIEGARFVPPGAEMLVDAMTVRERYMHEEPHDRLVQLAILHAEFEALHPFLDGNGRLGRMLVPLFLWQSGLIRAPVFYISAYFEAHREAYYHGLMAVSSDDDWTGWCRFFLQAVQAQAEENLAKAQAIVDLYDAMKERVRRATRSQYATNALDWIFARPVFRSTDFVSRSAIPKPTAQRFLKALRENGILDVIFQGRGRRPTVLTFRHLMDIVK